MDSFKFPNSPGTPLFPLSPERVNGTRSPYAAPNSSNLGNPLTSASQPSSPSKTKHEFGKSTPLVAYTAGTARPITAALAASMAAAPTIAPFQLEATPPPLRSPFRNAAAHSRNNSDAMVQGMIARFDGLSVRDWKVQGEVAVKRAEMAREMAEMESEKFKKQVEHLKLQMKSDEEERKKAREDARKVKKDVEEAKDRERKLTRRIEVLMDQLSQAQDTHVHTKTVYGDELRKAQKEAMKSSSSRIKVQEALNATRATLQTTQVNLETERQKAAKREQEAFTAQYQLVGVQEELQSALERCKVVGEERDALKTSLKEEEVLRVAAEGSIALPTTMDDDEDDLLLMSPSKSPVKSPRKLQRPVTRGSDSEKENVQPMRKSLVQLKVLQEELALERRLRQKAVDQIDFMKMECQFLSCSCRLAEQRGKKYVHDASFVHEMEQIKSVIPMMAEPASEEMVVDVNEYAATETQEEDATTIVIAMDKVSLSPVSHATTSIEYQAESQSEVRKSSQRRMSRYSRRASKRESLLHVSPSTAEIDDSHEALQEGEPAVVSEIPESFIEEQEEIVSENSSIYEDEDEDVGVYVPRSLQNTRSPHTPTDFEIRTVTTTTTIPMQFSPIKQSLPVISTLPNTPRTVSHQPYYHVDQGINDENRPPPTPNGVFKADGTIDRAAALEMINQRRVRARSMHLGQATPKKQMVEGNVRRDVSAPNVCGNKANGWKQ